MPRSFFPTCLLLALITAPVSRASAGDIPTAFRADIVELMRLTGAADMGVQFGSAMAKQFATSLRQARPDIPSRVWDIIGRVLDSFISNQAQQAVEELIPVYAKHFTHEEIRGLLDFYRTPLGQKLIGTTPVLLTESMQAGQAWSRRLLPAMQEELRKRLVEEGFLGESDRL